MWEIVATLAFKFISAYLTRKKADQEAQRKFMELAQHLQAKKLISANMRWNREENLSEMEKKRQEALKKRNQNN